MVPIPAKKKLVAQYQQTPGRLIVKNLDIQSLHLIMADLHTLSNESTVFTHNLIKKAKYTVPERNVTVQVYASLH